MNNNSLNKHLAEKIMKWALLPETSTFYARYYDPNIYDPELASDEQTYKFLVKDWNPIKNIEQAMMCIAAKAKVRLSKLTMANFARVFDIGADQNIPLTKAICLDLAKTTGWIE